MELFLFKLFHKINLLMKIIVITGQLYVEDRNKLTKQVDIDMSKKLNIELEERLKEYDGMNLKLIGPVQTHFEDPINYLKVYYSATFLVEE